MSAQSPQERMTEIKQAWEDTYGGLGSDDQWWLIQRVERLEEALNRLAAVAPMGLALKMPSRRSGGKTNERPEATGANLRGVKDSRRGYHDLAG